MTETVVFPATFTPGFMGFQTETEFMLDFTATMRECGLKSYPRTYAEVVARQNRPTAEPKSFVPAIVKPCEGGDMPTGGNGNGATYEGPKDLDYGKKFGKVPGTRSGRGIVHAMSEAQERYILRLLSTKDTTVLANNMVKGWTLDPTMIHTISKQHARPFIDALISCPDKKAANDSGKKELKGSPRQIEWITKGLNGKASLLTEKGILTESDITSFFTKHNYNAKDIIDALLKMPRPVIKSEVKQDEITEGMYTDGKRIIRAYMNREKTRLLAKELIQEDDDYSFSYLGMASRFITSAFRRMTLDEAKAFGRMTETCCVCGIHLSDPDSQKKGIGPWCEKQF